jgi:hypothetical protein
MGRSSEAIAEFARIEEEFAGMRSADMDEWLAGAILLKAVTFAAQGDVEQELLTYPALFSFADSSNDMARKFVAQGRFTESARLQALGSASER